MSRWLSWLLFGLLCGCTAPSQDGGSYGARLLADWLSAYNGGSRDAVDRFRERYGLQVDSDEVLAWREDSGKVALLRVEHDDADRIVALLQPETSDTVERIEFALTSATPARIASITYLNVDRPADLVLPRLDRTGALNAWQQRGDELALQERFSGVVLAARGDELVTFHAWGWADRDAKVRNGIETCFRLGSMNKMFTAVAILQLVDAGKLALDDTLGSHLPDYPNRDVARVTVRQLLGHTDGTGDIFGPEFDAHRLSLRTHADYLALFGARGLEHEPGAKLQYSNYGFILLGALIEKASGQDYYDYVRLHVFEPAGMTRTGSLPESDAVASRAIAYTREQGGWVSAADTLPFRGTAAGGGYSTAGDLLKFAQALERGTLLSRERFASALQPQQPGGWYGLGFMLGGSEAERWYGHDGGAAGMSAVMHHHPQSGWTVIALANQDPPAADRVAQYFENRMPLSR
jgi:D-alanyl-D-alanine carboxypeptidase